MPVQNKNTVMNFCYRDGANYKTHNQAVINGDINKGQIDAILGCLDSDGTFIPEQVGAPAERWVEYDPKYDHLWCELGEYSFEPTGAKATININAAELVRRFQAAAGHWDDGTQFPWSLELPDIDYEDEDYDENYDE